MASMKLVDGEINLSGWSFNDNEALNSFLSEAATETLIAAFSEDEPYLALASLPGKNLKTWSLPDDPLTILLSLPLGADDGTDPWYRISLTELALEKIGDSRPGGEDSNYAIDETEKLLLGKYVTALRALADKMEIEINRGVPFVRKRHLDPCQSDNPPKSPAP